MNIYDTPQRFIYLTFEKLLKLKLYIHLFHIFQKEKKLQSFYG